MRILYLFLVFTFIVSKAYSQLLPPPQRIKVNGQTTVVPNSQTRYELTYPTPQSNCKWLVTGGTIVSKNIIPGSPIFCNVLWDQNVSTGNVTIIVNGMSSTLNISILESNCMVADAGSDVSICGNSTVIGTPAIPGYSYSWSPTTGLNNPNVAQPTANPNSNTTYTLTMTPNNLFTNGDFELGHTGFGTDYLTFPAINFTCGNTYGSLSIGTDPRSLRSGWCNYTDHTPIGSNMLIVDGDCISSHRIWFQNVTVNPNTNYTFSGWTSSNINDVNDPQYIPLLRVRINGVDLISNFTVPYTSCTGWSQFTSTWNSVGSTLATIEIYDDNNNVSGNDFNLDDLFFSNCPISTDEVTVSVCPPCTIPTITPAGPIEKCVQYETGPWLTLSTDLTSNIQWYENGNAMSGQTLPTLLLTNNPNNGLSWPTCSSSITVKNTLTGCTSNPVQVTRKNFSSPQVYINEGPPYSTPTSYCLSQGGVIKQVPSTTNSNTTYWWEVYDPNGNPATGISITPMHTTNPNATISFSGYPYSTARVVAKASDNTCEGASDGSWNQSYIINVDLACKPANNNSIEKITLIPNPTSSQLTITSIYEMKQIEIYHSFYPYINKTIKVNQTKSVSINTNNLSPGVYFCKVTTINGIEYRKLQIIR